LGEGLHCLCNCLRTGHIAVAEQLPVFIGRPAPEDRPGTGSGLPCMPWIRAVQRWPRPDSDHRHILTLRDREA
jgi:hypothetical protein